MILHYIYNGIERLYIIVVSKLSWLATYILFFCSGIKFQKFKTLGVPYIHASIGSTIKIGNNFCMGNSILTNATGIKGRSKIEVRKNANLLIGENVGITLTTIECFNRITIGDGVRIGFGVHILDTDFHSIDPDIRLSSHDVAKTAPISIEKNVFIGAHSVILKGVTIGEGSVIGAGSIVTKSIPSHSVAAGNPAKVIYKINLDQSNSSVEI